MAAKKKMPKELLVRYHDLNKPVRELVDALNDTGITRRAAPIGSLLRGKIGLAIVTLTGSSLIIGGLKQQLRLHVTEGMVKGKKRLSGRQHYTHVIITSDKDLLFVKEKEKGELKRRFPSIYISKIPFGKQYKQSKSYRMLTAAGRTARKTKRALAAPIRIVEKIKENAPVTRMRYTLGKPKQIVHPIGKLPPKRPRTRRK